MKYRSTALAATLIALASPVFAQSSVSLYGVLDVFTASFKPSGIGKASVIQGSGGFTTSFWGINGQEDLGAGYKAIYALEGYVLVNSGAGGRFAGDPMFSRNAYVGLKSPYGQLSFGRQVAPLYLATASFNAQGGSFYFSPLTAQLWSGNFGRSFVGDTAWSNTISYTTPTLHGLSANFTYGFADTGTAAGMHNLGGVVNYTNGSFSTVAGAAQVEIGNGITTAGPMESVELVGASYNLDVAKLYLTLDHTTTELSGLRTTGVQGGATIPVGSNFIQISWMSSFEHSAARGSFRRDTAGIAYHYPLSKRTDLYAAYLYDRLTTASAGNTFGVGIKTSF
jgi:predicted porin